MNCLYIYTLFDKKTGRPRCTGIKDGNIVKICDLYRPGAGKTIKKIETIKKTIKKIIIKANSEQRRIIISDFKSHIASFDLPRDHRKWNVYDIHLTDIWPTKSSTKDFEIIQKVLDKMSTLIPQNYQNIIAQAAIVYQDMEDNGLMINCDPVWPKWSQKTFSGRSKTTGFNIQGLSDDFHVTTQSGSERDILIHFDWVCADIRAASLLSQDLQLQKAFDISDPYTIMMDILNINVNDNEKITREESKLYLLSSINSMDISSVALNGIYQDLGKWIYRCRSSTDLGKPLQTILGRKFRLAHSKNKLAVLNGVMQGSVAHAMQLVLRRIWDKLPNRLIAEIHDCLVVSSSPDSSEIKSVIDIIAPIMLYPFDGILDENPIFPINVSIGKKWKKWKLYKSYRKLETVDA